MRSTKAFIAAGALALILTGCTSNTAEPEPTHEPGRVDAGATLATPQTQGEIQLAACRAVSSKELTQMIGVELSGYGTTIAQFVSLDEPLPENLGVDDKEAGAALAAKYQRAGTEVHRLTRLENIPLKGEWKTVLTNICDGDVNAIESAPITEE